MRLILRETNSHRARGDIKLLRRLLIKWSYKRADSVVALSTGVHNELLHTYGLDPDKIVTIGNPVTIQHFTKECKAKEIRKLGVVSEDFPIIIAIGRLTYQKGFDILIRAFANVKSRAKLVILGEGTDRKKLQKLLK